MGCGSSSLKGEKAEVGTDAAPQPAKRVRTNFSDVDFSSGAGPDRRGTMAVAPDEQRRPTRVSEASAEAPDLPRSPTKSRAGEEKASQGHVDGGKLEPYHTLDGQDQRVEGAGAPTTKSEITSEMKTGDFPANPEADALATAGTNNANPIKA